MLCCSHCFTDRSLETFIERVSEESGDCPLCDTRNVPLCKPSALSKLLEPLFELYTPTDSPSGAPIHELIDKDWQILSHSGAAEVLESIAAELGISSHDRFELRGAPDGSLVTKWNDFAEELKTRNRFFPNTRHDANFLSFLLGNLYTPLLSGTRVFRARIKNGPGQYAPRDLKMPPSGVATAGRANPQGIPYFYTASDSDTAVSEVRPQRGETICVGEFEVLANLQLVDLRDPYRTFTPFGHEYGLDEILLKGLPLLKHLGEELAKPVLRSRAQLEYLPSQYLCEFIKMNGADGIIYNSSLGQGSNYATFTDKSFGYRSCIEVEVDGVNISTRPVR